MSKSTESKTLEAETFGMATGAIEYRMPAPLDLETLDNLYPQWLRFKQGFKIFISAAGLTNITETRKASILLNCIGQAAQELYFNVLQKSDDVSPKLEDVIQLFDGYFVPKSNEVVSTFHFNQRAQEDGESFDSYYTQLRKIAVNCNFETKLDRMLRDRIVVGINNKKTQQKLLEVKELTLERAVDICRSAELSRQQVKMIAKQLEPVVDAIQTQQQSQSNPVQLGTGYF